MLWKLRDRKQRAGDMYATNSIIYISHIIQERMLPL